ncbi:MAG: 4Fe-4S dicluster domain-containing protein [Candidatus Atribacteria bacterium]|jgi:2-oxoglutarate ferredoxin oxidoreductase subunit delta|nr:4Fe-4S dicluster domain-containing protein [Candidatus Atribacteria bacterium]
MEPKVVIDEDRCKSCGLCVSICPKKVLRISERINLKGYYPAELFDNENCISCGFCYLVCPDKAIVQVGRPEKVTT